MNEIEFNKALLEAVDEALLALGKSVKQAIYWRLEDRYNIKKNEIPNKIEEFNKALKELFGEGAEILMKTVMKRFYNKLNLGFEENPNWSIQHYVEDAKRRLSI
ncbi:MAG: hypothetical protein QXZ53_06780 [Candidatus Bathyarchaeia archaeon]